MLEKPKILGLLPARGGSKGLPGKNIRILHGRPLLGWAASALSNASSIDLAVCCSDDLDIQNVAKNHGLDILWTRPGALAQDNSLVIDVVLNALSVLETSYNLSFSYVALVQATSPFVLPQDIDCAVAKAIECNADTVISGTDVGGCHPVKMFTLVDDSSIRWMLSDDERQKPRQEYSPVFVRSGLIYVMSVESIKKNKSVYGKNIYSINIPRERSLEIDDLLDFELAEFMAEKLNKR